MVHEIVRKMRVGQHFIFHAVIYAHYTFYYSKVVAKLWPILSEVW